MIDSNELKQLVEYSKTLKLLYVEDNLDVREQSLKLFEELFNNITVSINGQDGLDKFKQNSDKPFDLIITDLNMPIMGGVDMIKNIRLIDKDIPIFVITAHTESSIQNDAKQYNINGFISKPIRLDQVIDIIKLAQK